MNENDLTEVQGAGEGLAQPTPNSPESGVSAQKPTVVETPAATPVDVEALKVKYEQDINKLKSTLQRQTAQVEQQWQSKYGDLQRQMHNIRMQGMTEDERARYERQLETEEFQTLQSRLAELENEKARQVEAVNAFNFFLAQGVPANKLNLAEGPEVIAQVGWQHMTEELARLRELASNPQPVKPAGPAPLKQAPEVITDKGTPASGTTWAALRAQYGTDEAVYRAVEEGRLPSSVIPTG
jgi:hypothetical protein